MTGNTILDVIIIVLTTFVISVSIMPIMKKVAKHIGAIDKPRNEEEKRHIHKVATPKLGAVGIFISFLFGYMFFADQSIEMNSILIGSFFIIMISIADDIKPIKNTYRLIVQLIAASIIVFYGNILLTEITAFGFTLDFNLFAYPITIIFIIACTNIINLIDGIDGLSSGISSIFFLTIGIIAIMQGRETALVVILTFIMLGSTLGFLFHNFNPATIFAGDGANFLGFIIAVITLLEFKGPALISFFIPLMILAIPILDTTFAIIRRTIKKKPIFGADKGHLHHQLLGMNFSQKNTVLIIYGINILFAIASIFYMIEDQFFGIIIYAIILVLVIWFVLHTSIISEKNPEKIKKIKKQVKDKFKPKKS